MLPGHDQHHIYALLPLLAILAVLDPAEAVATAIGIVLVHAEWRQ